LYQLIDLEKLECRQYLEHVLMHMRWKIRKNGTWAGCRRHAKFANHLSIIFANLVVHLLKKLHCKFEPAFRKWLNWKAFCNMLRGHFYRCLRACALDIVLNIDGALTSQYLLIDTI